MTDPDLVKQFGGKLLNIYTGGVLTKLIEVGYQVGLFEASKDGPATSEELSERKGTWSVRVSGNWRITFAFSGTDADAVDYEDYH
jgi:hypothetical protein